jgi:hypothetical protein
VKGQEGLLFLKKKKLFHPPCSSGGCGDTGVSTPITAARRIESFLVLFFKKELSE